MAVSSVTRIWTAVQHAFRAILAYFGFAAPVAADRAAPAAPAAGLLPAQSAAGTRGPVRWTPPRAPLPLERSLPPTIKQRIHAEAHGSSPSVRRMNRGTDADGTAPSTGTGGTAGPARSALAPGTRSGTPGTRSGTPGDRPPGAAIVRPRRRV